MKKVVTVFYSFQEFDELLRRCCFTNKELFDVEVVDRYFGESIIIRTIQTMV